MVQFPERCETILRAPVGQHPVVSIEGNRLTVRGNRARGRLRCPEEATSRCQGTLRILGGTTGSRAIGRARYSVREGERGTVRVRVRSTPNRVRAATREIGPDDRPKESIKQLRLRRG